MGRELITVADKQSRSFTRSSKPFVEKMRHRGAGGVKICTSNRKLVGRSRSTQMGKKGAFVQQSSFTLLRPTNLPSKWSRRAPLEKVKREDIET